MLEADEVVTIDVRRQIRWPTSLHGKSGLRVTEFPLSRLDPDGSNHSIRSVKLSHYQIQILYQLK